MVGGGLEDPWRDSAMLDLAWLRHAGASASADFVQGGHEAYAWRALLRDFVERFAPVRPSPRRADPAPAGGRRTISTTDDISTQVASGPLAG